MLDLCNKTTALILIDLQKGILAEQLTPLTGRELLAAGIAEAQKFRSAGALVVLVNVGWSHDFADAPGHAVDRALHDGSALPADWSELADGLAQSGDLLITKRQWGAFHGTELDLQLRRRGIKTVVVGGVATNYGVESTARQAWELHYDVVVLQDVTTTISDDLQAMAFKWIFPMISRVVNGGDLSVSAT